MRFFSEEFTTLDVLISKASDGATVKLLGDKKVTEKAVAGYLVSFSLLQNTQYELKLENASSEFVYLASGDEICENGIKILLPNAKQSYNPYKEQCHFTAPTGWLNDPNGVCFFGGYYHMYYQFYPHNQQWGNMHWGHTVSKDLVFWAHQRVFLVPQEELLFNLDYVGGAFSGSAINIDNEIYFYFTRHIALQANESTMRETQCLVKSKNGVSPYGEQTLIQNIGKEISYHFRDPKVAFINNNYYMVLGSCVKGIPSILMYKSKDGIDWNENGTLLKIDVKGCESIECPDFFRLEDKYIAFGALMNYTEKNGRKNPVMYYMGEFCEDEFTSQKSGILDFGGNFYAVQSFEHNNRRIAIAWVADFYNEHIQVNGGVCGSLTLPREITIQNGKLYTYPVQEIQELKGKILYVGAETNIELDIEEKAYYAEILLCKECEFVLTVAKSKNDNLSFVKNENDIAFVSTRIKNTRFSVDNIEIEKIEVFCDARTCEIFLNNGEAAGTKTFYCEKQSFAFSAKDVKHIKKITVKALKKGE